MGVHRTIRYRVHPRAYIKACKLAGTAGARRFVWNHFVARSRHEYKFCGAQRVYRRCNYSFYTAGKQFSLLRKHNEKWLQEYSMHMVRQALRPIETAYKQFFEGNGGLPHFHARHMGSEIHSVDFAA